MSTDLLAQYRQQGYVVLPNVISAAEIQSVEQAYLDVVRRIAARTYVQTQDPELIAWLQQNPHKEAEIYDVMAADPVLVRFSQQASLLERLKPFFPRGVGLLRKIIFRMDEPLRTSELAHWHQDNFYVKGNPDVITAWIPLQDVRFVNGCLSVMPGSQTLGLLEHDLVLGKRHVPTGIFDREIRMLEMRKGDVLLFHSCLLHSSNLNLSSQIRYTVQARYSPLDGAWDAGMKGLIQLPI